MDIIEIHASDLGEKRQEIIALIEKEFPYPKEHSFYDDFLPLMHPKAQTDHYIIEYDQQVIAHIGYQTRNLIHQNTKFPIGMLGGVCVAKTYQGRGIASKLIDHVLQQQRQKVSLFLLWSNLHDFYQKKGFELAIGQREYTQTVENLAIPNLMIHPLCKTSPEQQKIIKNIYQQNFQHFTLPERTQQFWDILFSMKTPLVGYDQLNLEKGYFFMGKGADLPGIIHELFGEKGWINLFTETTMWAPEIHPFLESNKFILNPLALICPGETKLYKEFSASYGKGENIVDIFGPGLKHKPLFPLFIPGLDSV